MEKTLSDLADNPWMFGVLGLLALISAIPTLWKTTLFIFRFSKNATQNGIGTSVSWVKGSARAKAEKIASSKVPGVLVGAMIFESLFLMVFIVITGFVMLLALITGGIYLTMFSTSALLGIESDISPDFRPAAGRRPNPWRLNPSRIPKRNC